MFPGIYKGQPAAGTPLAWSTNNVNDIGYQHLNVYGEHYWMLDAQVDCARTEQGWFEFKGVKVTDYHVVWESGINQRPCAGNAGVGIPYNSDSHFAWCGKVNVFEFESDVCEINNF